MCLVSVVIPFYNVEAYIGETLQSICGQTLKDMEILCINDGSPDRSIEIVRSYAARDPRIRVFEQENGGLSAARNHGIREARGKYLYFIDSDDRLRSDALEVLCREAEEHGLDLIYFDAVSFFDPPSLEDTKKGEHYKSFYHRPDSYAEVCSGPELFTRMERNDHFRASACLQMSRRSLLEQHGIRFREGILHEDELFSLQVLCAAARAKHLAEPFYERRVREGSIMTDAGNAFRRSRSDCTLVREMGAVLENMYRARAGILTEGIPPVPAGDECAALLEARIRKMQLRGVKQAESLPPGELEEEIRRLPPEERRSYDFLIVSLLKERAAMTKKWKKKLKDLQGKTDSLEKEKKGLEEKTGGLEKEKQALEETAASLKRELQDLQKVLEEKLLLAEELQKTAGSRPQEQTKEHLSVLQRLLKKRS